MGERNSGRVKSVERGRRKSEAPIKDVSRHTLLPRPHFRLLRLVDLLRDVSSIRSLVSVSLLEDYKTSYDLDVHKPTSIAKRSRAFNDQSASVPTSIKRR